ncbi:hypothetical protein Bca4012_052214 [Brassica carinata]
MFKLKASWKKTVDKVINIPNLASIPQQNVKLRHSRLHNQTSKPAHSVVKDIYLLLRAKLYSLDMEQRALPSAAQRNRRHSTTTTYLSGLKKIQD